MGKRVHEENQENMDPLALPDQRGHEEREASWASLGQKETRETWAHLDHLVRKVNLERKETNQSWFMGLLDLQDPLGQLGQWGLRVC